MGMTINFDGKVIDKIPIRIWGHKGYRRIYRLRVPRIQISFNINKEKGFIIGYRPFQNPRAIVGYNSLIPTVKNYSFIYNLNNTFPNSLRDLIIADLIGQICFRSWKLQNLLFGGYMLTERAKIGMKHRLYTYIFADNGTLYNILGLEQPLQTNLNYEMQY
ncbi:hypothetical protein C1646_811485 [Rhizophagus diaphanus]|nr:hypothetical protein C1646_811485 [Rhizophagus diaphanus] [Rhizophagus sp. MUCL 43196]